MKKRLFVTLAVVLLLFSQSACSSGTPSQPSTTSATPNAETPTEAPTESPLETNGKVNDATVAEPQTETAGSSEKTISDLEEYMLREGVLSGTRTQMAAEMIGAISGFKYSDSNAEIYVYDVESEEYIALSKGESIELQGLPGFAQSAVAVNGPFALFGEPSQELIDCFKSFE